MTPVDPLGTSDDLRKLLSRFLEAGYECASFLDSEHRKRQLILRHDIDMDTGYALEVAAIEKDLGMTATYFFLVSSDFYNVFSPLNRERLTAIAEMGHTVSIHFDPTAYRDIDAGLRMEIDGFSAFLGIETRVVSLHRPHERFIGNPDQIGGLTHTYQPRFVEGVTYISDSRGSFRFGHPLESEAFTNGEPIHLLLHPLWWMTPAGNPLEKLRHFVGRHSEENEHHMAANSLVYREYLEGAQ